MWVSHPHCLRTVRAWVLIDRKEDAKKTSVGQGFMGKSIISAPTLASHNLTSPRVQRCRSFGPCFEEHGWQIWLVLQKGSKLLITKFKLSQGTKVQNQRIRKEVPWHGWWFQWHECIELYRANERSGETGPPSCALRNPNVLQAQDGLWKVKHALRLKWLHLLTNHGIPTSFLYTLALPQRCAACMLLGVCPREFQTFCHLLLSVGRLLKRAGMKNLTSKLPIAGEFGGPASGCFCHTSLPKRSGHPDASEHMPGATLDSSQRHTQASNPQSGIRSFLHQDLSRVRWGCQSHCESFDGGTKRPWGRQPWSKELGQFPTRQHRRHRN